MDVDALTAHKWETESNPPEIELNPSSQMLAALQKLEEQGRGGTAGSVGKAAAANPPHGVQAVACMRWLQQAASLQ